MSMITQRPGFCLVAKPRCGTIRTNPKGIEFEEPSLKWVRIRLLSWYQMGVLFPRLWTQEEGSVPRNPHAQRLRRPIAIQVFAWQNLQPNSERTLGRSSCRLLAGAGLGWENAGHMSVEKVNEQRPGELPGLWFQNSVRYSFFQQLFLRSDSILSFSCLGLIASLEWKPSSTLV